MRITIQTGNEKKGRSFSVELLSYVSANRLWDGGHTDTQKIRPVWMAFGGSQQECRIFWANLRKGRVAEYSNIMRFEIMKSANYQFHIQKLEDGVVYYVYLQDLFLMNPGMVDPKSISFVVLPPKLWIEQQPPPSEAMLAYLQKLGMQPMCDMQWLASVSMLFLLYLDRRTRYPIPNDPCFAAQLFLQSSKAGFITTHDDRYNYRYAGDGFTEYELDAVGMGKGFAFNATHDSFNPFLSREIQVWHALNQ